MMKNWITITGKIILLTLVFSIGLIASRIILYRLGLTIPRMPNQAPESVAGYYLFSGSFLISLGLFPLIQSLTGSSTVRLAIIWLFFFTCFGGGVTIESAIYSSMPAYHLMILTLFLPVLLFSLTAALVPVSWPVLSRQLAGISRYFRSRSATEWMWRSLLAVLSFPLVYFIFGLIVSPLVTEYYKETVPGLALPGPGTILMVQLIRSILFLVVTLPVITHWGRSWKHCVLSLGLAHFVMVFAYDIVLALQMPVELIIIHGIELLFDSFIYAWIFVKLMKPADMP